MKPRSRQLLADASVFAGLLVVLGAVYTVDPYIKPSKSTAQPQSGRRSFFGADSMYDLRTRENREQWLPDLGATKESEQAVKAGLAWLARHQGLDGSWSNSALGRPPVCTAEDPCSVQGRNYPFAQTGLALLAFQAGGHYDYNGHTHSDQVRKGLDWLVANQREDGGLYASTADSHYMYEHGIAAFALADACAVAADDKRDPKAGYRAAAEKAIRFIENQQYTDGGWRYTQVRTSSGDTSVSGWQVLAIKSAKEGGLEVSSECVHAAVRFFKGCEAGGGKTGYMANSGAGDAMTGVGMLVHQFLLETPESELVQQGASYLAELAGQRWGEGLSVTPDYYLWYNCTLAMKQAPEDDWNRWNDIVRERLIELQLGEDQGCARGSWSPESSYGTWGGRIYTTALAVLTLEVYYRYAKTTAVRQR